MQTPPPVAGRCKVIQFSDFHRWKLWAQRAAGRVTSSCGNPTIDRRLQAVESRWVRHTLWAYVISCPEDRSRASTGFDGLQTPGRALDSVMATGCNHEPSAAEAASPGSMETQVILVELLALVLTHQVARSNCSSSDRATYCMKPRGQDTHVVLVFAMSAVTSPFALTVRWIVA